VLLGAKEYCTGISLQESISLDNSKNKVYVIIKNCLRLNLICVDPFSLYYAGLTKLKIISMYQLPYLKMLCAEVR